MADITASDLFDLTASYREKFNETDQIKVIGFVWLHGLGPVQDAVTASATIEEFRAAIALLPFINTQPS